MPKKTNSTPEPTIEQVQKIFDEYTSAVVKMSKNSIVKSCEWFFEKYPEAKAIAWHQYTPGFNDGNPCEFSMGEINLICDKPVVLTDSEKKYYPDLKDFVLPPINELKVNGIDNVEDEFPESIRTPAPGEMEKDWNKLRKLLNNEDLMERMFGSDKKIAVFCDNTITVDEYDCGY